MLSETKLSLLQQLVQNASEKEIIWANGYLAGILAETKFTTPINLDKKQEIAVKPTIIYATETGNCKKIASKLLGNFKKNKIQAKTIDILQFDVNKLEKESTVLFVVSTQGDGEFPQNAQSFYNKLNTENYNLKNLKYSVLGLGDSSYPLFCNAGILLDEVLLKSGAQQITPLKKADTDYEQAVEEWENQLLIEFERINLPVIKEVGLIKTEVSKEKVIYKGIISHKVILNDTGSNKETYHLEISSENEVTYEPGDALGIVARNELNELKKIIYLLNEEESKTINYNNKNIPLIEVLEKLNIKGLSKFVLDKIAPLLEIEIKESKIDLIDVLERYNFVKNFEIEALVNTLQPIAPRLYSISSATDAHNGEVHLTVNLHKFKVNEVQKTGLASRYLSTLAKDSLIEFYIHTNKNFKLPAEDVDIIMIGPGTGIAPFRSFIAQRDVSGSSGKNWLFFGEQHFTLDFYYQTEIQDWIASGVLNKFDAAFSRDQKQKIYVQDRIIEQAKEFNAWLEKGAYLYLCGQKDPMSKDVEAAIIKVIAAQRSISIASAQEILETLEMEGKFQKDIY